MHDVMRCKNVLSLIRNVLACLFPVVENVLRPTQLHIQLREESL